MLSSVSPQGPGLGDNGLTAFPGGRGSEAPARLWDLGARGYSFGKRGLCQRGKGYAPQRGAAGQPPPARGLCIQKRALHMCTLVFCAVCLWSLRVHMSVSVLVCACVHIAMCVHTWDECIGVWCSCVRVARAWHHLPRSPQPRPQRGPGPAGQRRLRVV